MTMSSRERTSDMSKFLIPFTLGHLVLSSRLFHVASTLQPMRNSSAIIVEQNLARFVPGCISLGHIQPRLYPVGTHAVLLLLLRSIGSPGRLKATEPDRMKSGRAHGYHYLDKTERGWPLSRSSLCILPLFPFSIGNLFRTSRVRTILVTGASLGSTRTLLIVGVIAVTAKEGHRLLDHLVPLTIL